MKPVTLYTKPTCPYCINAKKLLNDLGVPFTDHDVAADPDLRAKVSASVDNFPTVPMIFVGDQFVGGYSDLKALHDQGRLDAMLK